MKDQNRSITSSLTYYLHQRVDLTRIPCSVLLSVTTEVGFSSGTEEETSGYESEGGRSLSPSAHTDCTSASSPPSPLPGRRPRTAFTAEQISSMERAFKRNAYLGTQDKAELCKKLNLSDKQVTTIDLLSIRATSCPFRPSSLKSHDLRPTCIRPAFSFYKAVIQRSCEYGNFW